MRISENIDIVVELKFKQMNIGFQITQFCLKIINRLNFLVFRFVKDISLFALIGNGITIIFSRIYSINQCDLDRRV